MTDATMQLAGMHHVSALSAHIARSHDFYTRVLGLRPLIKTVNQDDPGMYHLFFGDGAGTPGSDMTVFDLPHAAQEHRGNNSISLTTFRVDVPGAKLKSNDEENGFAIYALATPLAPGAALDMTE